MEPTKLPHRHGDGQQTELIQKQLNHVDYFQTVAEVFKQLGDTTRIRIFWLLCHREEHFCHVGNVKSGCVPPPPAIEEQRPDCLPP